MQARYFLCIFLFFSSMLSFAAGIKPVAPQGNQPVVQQEAQQSTQQEVQKQEAKQEIKEEVKQETVKIVVQPKKLISPKTLKLYVSPRPATLIEIDGKPDIQAVGDSTVERVVNTEHLIFLDPKGDDFYLKAGSRWYTSQFLHGQWKFTRSVPADVKQVAAQFKALKKQYVRNRNFIVSTIPATLVVFKGELNLEPVVGTDLSLIKNASQRMFLQADTQQYYLHDAYGWYRSDSFASGTKWVKVDEGDLPGAFADVPQELKAIKVVKFEPGSDVKIAAPRQKSRAKRKKAEVTRRNNRQRQRQRAHRYLNNTREPRQRPSGFFDFLRNNNSRQRRRDFRQ